MGFLSLPSHIDQGFIFTALGFWHLLNTLHNYVKKPGSFRSRTWFPVYSFPGTLKCIELWLLLSVVVFFILKQLFRARSDLISGIIQTSHLQRFHHVSFAILFLIYILVALLSEHSLVMPIPEGALHATFALGFTLELFVFHFGHHPGDNLESFVHLLMQFVLFFLSLFMYLEILWPRSILLSTARCMVLLLKGTWFFQIGLLINMPFATPLGCEMGANDFPMCPNGDAERRAKSIQVLVFNLQIAGIVVLTYTVYGIFVYAYQVSVSRKGYCRQLQYPVREDTDRSDDSDFMEEPRIDEDVPVINVVPGVLSRRKSQNARVILADRDREQLLSVSSP